VLNVLEIAHAMLAKLVIIVNIAHRKGDVAVFVNKAIGKINGTLYCQH
jgi:hypothetical protein